MTESQSRPTSVADYLAILRRRKWMVLLPPITAGIAAFFLSSGQAPLYHASAQIYVNRTSVVSAITQISTQEMAMAMATGMLWLAMKGSGRRVSAGPSTLNMASVMRRLW